MPGRRAPVFCSRMQTAVAAKAVTDNIKLAISGGPENTRVHPPTLAGMQFGYILGMRLHIRV